MVNIKKSRQIDSNFEMVWAPKTLDPQCSFLCLAIICSSYSLIKCSSQMKTDRYKSEYINALRNAFYDFKALEQIESPLKKGKKSESSYF